MSMNKIKKIFLSSIKGMMVILLLYYIFHKINFKDIIDILDNTPKKMIFIIYFIYTILFVIKTIKWKLLLKDSKFKELINVMAISGTTSFFIGGQIFGEGLKILCVKGDREEITSSILFDKLTGLLAAVIVGTIGMLLSNNIIEQKVQNLYVICSIVLIVCFYLFSTKHVENIVKHLRKMFHSANKIICKPMDIIENIICICGKYAKNIKLSLESIILGIVLQTLDVLYAYCIIKILNIQIGFFDMCWIHVILSLASLIPLSVFGLGITQVTMIGLLSALGINSNLSASYSLLHYAITFSVYVLQGLAGIIMLKINNNLSFAITKRKKEDRKYEKNVE